MTEKRAKPFAHAPKSTGDLSHIDMSYLRDAAHAGSREKEVSAGDTGPPGKMDRQTLTDIVQGKPQTRHTVRAFTNLSEEQALALAAYGVLTDQTQSAVIRHAITRFLESEEFSRTVTKRDRG